MYVTLKIRVVTMSIDIPSYDIFIYLVYQKESREKIWSVCQEVNKDDFVKKFKYS